MTTLLRRISSQSPQLNVTGIPSESTTLARRPFPLVVMQRRHRTTIPAPGHAWTGLLPGTTGTAPAVYWTTWHRRPPRRLDTGDHQIHRHQSHTSNGTRSANLTTLRRHISGLSLRAPHHLSVVIASESNTLAPALLARYQAEKGAGSGSSFDPSKHPRDNVGRFTSKGEGETASGGVTSAFRAKNQGNASSSAPLRPKLRRTDTFETGTGHIWDVDGRPWELTRQQVKDWEAITSRGALSDGLSRVVPSFWTSIEDFEAEVRRQARSYRDQILRVEGSAADANPIDLAKRHRDRAQTALQRDFTKAASTVDNATFVARLAKAPWKMGVKALTTTAERQAAAAIRAEARSLATKQIAKAAAEKIDDVGNLLKIHIPDAVDTQAITVKSDSWALRHAEITSRLQQHLSHALKQAKLTPSQLKDAQRSGRGPMHWGTQIDTRFKNLVQNDYLLHGDVVVSPRKLPSSGGAPDVIDLRSKRWWDATTTAEEFAKKLPKYESTYGEGTSLLYSQP